MHSLLRSFFEYNIACDPGLCGGKSHGKTRVQEKSHMGVSMWDSADSTRGKIMINPLDFGSWWFAKPLHVSYGSFTMGFWNR